MTRLGILRAMRAEFSRSDQPDRVVAAAEWDGRRAVLKADDDELRGVLERIFRASSVALDDPALRSAGTSGATVFEPGDEEWFRVAALTRGREAGLEVRFVDASPGGWDPALDPQTFGWAGTKSST